MARSSVGKRQREQAKKEKASAKLERRQRLTEGHEDDANGEPPEQDEASTETILAMLQSVHERFEAGEMSYDDFEAAKTELLARLTID